MPELPEVEHAARQLQSWMQGRCIGSAWAEEGVLRAGAGQPHYAQSTDPTNSQRNGDFFAGFFSGKTLSHVKRHGKNLFLFFEGGGKDNDNWILHVHLGMTGKFVLRSHGVSERYSRFQWALENKKTIHFRDPRKFGYCSLVKSEPDILVVTKLGPDVWLTPPDEQELGKRLSKVRRPVKVALMEQEILAGLGNIQAAEALYRARINPQRKADQLTFDELAQLAKGIKETLEYSLAQLPPLSKDIEYVEEPGAHNPFLVYGKAGTVCSRCNTTVESFRQNGRTTYWCPGCQV